MGTEEETEGRGGSGVRQGCRVTCSQLSGRADHGHTQCPDTSLPTGNLHLSEAPAEWEALRQGVEAELLEAGAGG